MVGHRVARVSLDYTKTARRHGWSQVPAGVVRALGQALDSAVIHASPPVGAGFGGQYAGDVRLADGRRVFVKAAPPWIAYQASCLELEAAVLRRLPSSVPHCRPLARVSRDGWALLALEHVDGTMPGFPWSLEHLDAVYASCLALSRVRAPTTYTERPWGPYFHRGDRHGADIREIRSGSCRRPAAHGDNPWLDAMVSAHGAELADLADASRTITGPHLLHQDVRPDNILVDRRGRARLVDWNWVCLGPAWVDFVGLLPMAHRQGLDVTPWLEARLFTGATDDVIDAVLAAIAVKMLGGQHEPLPPGMPETLWQHKLLQAHDAVLLLADRRGWKVRSMERGPGATRPEATADSTDRRSVEPATAPA